MASLVWTSSHDLCNGPSYGLGTCLLKSFIQSLQNAFDGRNVKREIHANVEYGKVYYKMSDVLKMSLKPANK